MEINKNLLKALANMTYTGRDPRGDKLRYVYHDIVQNSLLACNGYQLALVKFDKEPFNPEAMMMARFDPDDIKLLCETKGKTFDPHYFDQYTHDRHQIEPAMYLLRHTIKQEYKPIESEFRHCIFTSALEKAFEVVKCLCPLSTLELALVDPYSRPFWVFYRKVEITGVQVWFVTSAGSFKDNIDDAF